MKRARKIQDLSQVKLEARYGFVFTRLNKETQQEESRLFLLSPSSRKEAFGWYKVAKREGGFIATRFIDLQKRICHE
jgi:hypothetical protein